MGLKIFSLFQCLYWRRLKRTDRKCFSLVIYPLPFPHIHFFVVMLYFGVNYYKKMKCRCHVFTIGKCDDMTTKNSFDIELVTTQRCTHRISTNNDVVFNEWVTKIVEKCVAYVTLIFFVYRNKYWKRFVVLSNNSLF